MAAWPRSAYVVIAVLLVSCGAGAYWLYTETRTAYRAVGFNDGQILQRQQTLKTIQQSVAIEDCNRHVGKPPVDLLSIKAESLKMIVIADGSVRFCR